MLNEKPTLSDAIVSLGIEGGWKIKEGKIVKWWADEAQPSDSAIDTKLTELIAEYNAQEYSRNRKAEYDALNQLEMQFDDKEDGTTTWEDAIKAIKAKWPKDNSGPV